MTVISNWTETLFSSFIEPLGEFGPTLLISISIDSLGRVVGDAFLSARTTAGPFFRKISAEISHWKVAEAKE